MPSAFPGQIAKPTRITAGLLRQWPLPRPEDTATGGRGKESRGSVLVAGGSTEIPGALILAGTAALRVGAGKLQIATCRDVAQAVAITVPEARVLGLPTSASGDIDPGGAELLQDAIGKSAASVIGPGVLDIPTIQNLLGRLLPEIHEGNLVIDAGALSIFSKNPGAVHHLGGTVVLTPHTVEMSHMLDIDEDAVIEHSTDIAREAATKLQAVVALKGADTVIAAPDGTTYIYDESTIGIATSGSGDTLAGIIGGLLARGAPAFQAAVWGVYLHGSAGRTLVERMGNVGFLARELLPEIPAIMGQFDI